VTVTTAGLLPLAALGIPLRLVVLEVDDEVVVEDVDDEFAVEEVDDEVDDEVVVEEVDNDVEPVSVELSEPVMPPSTPAAVSRPRTFLSVVQTRVVPGVWMLGMARHSRPFGHCSEVTKLGTTHFAMLPPMQAVSPV
jgi:hypothetical protein